MAISACTTLGAILSSTTHWRLMRLYSARTTPSADITTEGVSDLALRKSPMPGVNGTNART